MESAEQYKKTEDAYEECSAHYEKIIAQMKNSFVSEYDDTIKTIADKIGDEVEKVDDKEALKNAASEFTAFKDTLKGDCCESRAGRSGRAEWWIVLQW